jgi:hypothetical protein
MPHMVMMRPPNLLTLLLAFCGSKLRPVLVSLLLGHHLAAVHWLFGD